MKIFLIIGDERRKAQPPFAGADHAVVEGECPKCKCADFKVQGSGKRPSADDRAWEADGYALCCDQHVGLIRAEPNTLFGVREDERVSRMGVRIY